MSSLEEKIPAFSMWKMFNDTVPVIIKAECWEASIRKLASIIQSKEYSNILFIYNKEYNVTNEQYQEIQEKYKAFTVWLLGQFFYLLGNEKFSKVHDIIVDIQLSILDQLFNTQLDVFKELSKEYKKVLKLLVDYYKTANQKLVLQVFIPGNLEELNQELNLNPVFMEIQSPSKCTLILQKLLKFIEYMLTKNFTSCGFDEYTFSMLDHLLFLLSNSSEELQLEIADVFIELSTKNTDSINHPEIKSKFLLFSSLFEKFVYRTFNSREINKKNTTKCEQCLLKYLSSSEKTRHLFTNIPHITAFLFNITLNSRKGFAPSEELQIIAAKYVGNELKDNSIDYRLENLDFSNVAIIFSFYDQIYNDIGAIEGPCENLKIYSEDISKIWSRIYKIIINELAQKKCGEDCNISRFLHFFKSLSKMLVQINLNLIKSRNHPISFSYFDEIELMVNFIRKYLNHASNCQKSNTTFEDALHFFIAFISVTNSKNIHIIFNIIGFPILKTFVYKSENQFPINVIAEEKTIGDIKMIVRSFYRYLWTQNISRSISLKALNKLFLLISSKLITPKQSSVREIENLYMKICKLEFQSKNLDNMLLVIESIPHILTIFEDTDRILAQIINPAILLQISKVLESTLYTLHNVLCAVSLDFLKIVYWDDDRNCLQSTICCKKCTLQTNSDYVDDLIYQKFGQNAVAVKYNKIQVEHHMISSNLKHVLNSISKPCLDLKMAALGTLPSFSSHLLQFHSVDVTQIWVQLAADPNKEVRDKFTQVIEPIVTFCYDNPVLSEDIKSHIIRVIFSEMLDFTERSLKESNFDLQETLLCTLEAIGKVNSGCVWLETLKLFIHFIMTPTSKYNLDAVDRCFKLAENNKTSTTIIYSQNKKEICEVITQLCCAVESNLATSLEQVAHMLGFYGSKDFVNQECNYLLPFFVAKTVKMPAVKSLIQEMATMMDIDLGEMLSSKYGYIFIHIFLEDMPNEDIKQCMMFLENSTHSSGVSLRKRNFRIILNELLLNFHEKNDKVLLALRLLSNEDFENQGKANSIQEYLQSHFLGVLLYFDLKMISKNAGKDKFLLSLADLFKFMGSKHIMPLRFKIIAMLQTINYKNFPRLTCTIWDAFIRTCEIESLGPHLAVICVSLLPLIDHCTTEVNDMLNYLIIQNEIHMKNHIPDLFFVSHNKINLEIIMVIRKYLELFEKNNLKQKIQRFLKYIMHESTEVRIQGLKQLKTYLEQDREALDQMILDYNGIDATIVELIDVLTTGCREKDETLKLACGDLFGELGAIEPSHLPRRYTQEDTSFCFYINEDTFIVNSLNELIKAFQAEKNTQSMDRYALAIQETLKGYEISPDPHSNKHYLWVQFPDTQREVMLPLLSSRYMIAQPVLATNLTTPIYGSTSGSTFQAWLYNWTCSLISSLPDERKTLLKVYLPSMKQDQRILMHFMPHILLHALLEGSDRIAEKCLVEIQTITSSITDNRAILNVRPDINTETPTVTPEKIKQIQCTKVVFLLLDYLDRWVREWQWQKGMEGSTEKHFKIITCFLNKLCKLQLAKCNYQSGEYPRALMYLEDYITDSNGELHNNLSFFAEIYAQLEEPDGVDGVMALQPNEPSLEQRILALEVAGKLADATNCYERMPQPLQLQHIQGLTQCYLGLDNVNTALYFVKGALNSQQEFNNMLLEMQAEPLWRLGQYDELNTLIKDPKLSKNKSWGVQVGKALLHIKNGERNYFKSTIDGLMMQQVFSFSATSLEEGAYKSGYGCVSKLHALNELQQVEKIIFDLLDSPNNREYAENVIKKLSKEWSLRIKVVQESVGIIEPILCLRRVSLNLAKHIAEEKFQTAVPYLNSLIGESWLLSAKTARSAGMHQQAYTYSIKAEEYAPSTLFLDKAKLHWLREEHEQALHCLRRGVEVIMPEGSSPDMLTIEQRKLCAEAKLLMATYNEELSNVDIDVNRQIFKESVEIFKEWEKSLVCLAHFLDKLFQSYSSAEQDSRGSDLQLQMINYFGKSLQYGTHYIYQSMPRMLSIWFDYGTRLLEVGQNSVKEERKLILLRMTKLIDCFLERLPSYVFLTAFSQLVSRICHPQKEVYIMLKSIIIKLVQQYPQQSLWMVISVIKSSYSVRSKRCAEILCDPRLKTTSLTRLVRDFTSLAEKLIELCNKEIPADANTASVNSLLRTLPRLLAKDDFSEIMMPTFKLRKLIIPNPDFSNAQHNPFPNAYVYIVGIEDEISVLQSLQKPRKIALKGSDGKRYIFMLKPKDDLRKDFRLMEFNDIVNHLLAREGEARQRRLNIRLYSVAPLNEECGLIEWVHNLVGLRPVLLSLYKQKG